jgi:hypothetical protein
MGSVVPAFDYESLTQGDKNWPQNRGKKFMFEKLDALFGGPMLTLELVSPIMDILKELNLIF